MGAAGLHLLRRFRAARVALERARTLLRRHVPKLEQDRKMAPDIETAAELVTTGALIEALRPATLPALDD